jgi:hypothetical protein
MRALVRPLAEFGWDRPPRLWASRQEAEQVAASWRDLPVTARADDDAGSFIAMVADPPPVELSWQGRMYYLAHFNARRAVYSPLLPPSEPPAAG